METPNLLLVLINIYFLLNLNFIFSNSSNIPPIGIHPLGYFHVRSLCSIFINLSLILTLNLSFYFTDEKYFNSEVISCKDGSNSFTRDRINDEFCDCVDGTDEPGIV